MSNATPTLPGEGDVLADKYAVERVLGSGGMGVVVAARHSALGHKVALKFLLPEALRSGDAKERFLREAQAVVGIKSEHVARVLDVGTLASGAPFIVMEHLDGCDLGSVVLERGELPVQEAIEYVLQACEALAEAHALGIVHRDLKPANLFLTSHADGSPLVKVLDFGISKLLSASAPGGSAGLTRTDTVMGSPAYMSPEQIRSAKNVDTRADIWAMGVILYELLTAKPPFDAENLATLSTQICMDSPTAINRRDLPAPLMDTVLRCLEKEPSQRFQTLAELARELAPYAAPASRTLVERICRIAPAGGHDQTLPASAELGSDSRSREEHSVAATADTVAATSSTVAKAAAARPKGMLLWGGGALLSVCVLVAAYALFRSTKTDVHVLSASHEPWPALLPPTAAPTAVSEPPPAPSAPAAASASAMPRAQSSFGRARKQTLRCPAGLVANGGHCCPVGMVWNETRCDRPLAKDIPF